MAYVTGTFGLFSLVDLFQLLTASARTGRLAVDHPRGLARIYFDRGRVVHAEFGQLAGEEAVFVLFADERGSFEFTVGLPAPETSISGSTENLMLEAIRRVDESEREETRRKEAVGDDAVPVLTPQSAEKMERVELKPTEVAVFSLIDNERTLQDIAQIRKLPLERVVSIIHGFTQLGAVKLRSKQPRTARLVTQLARESLPTGVAGVDSNILANWERTLGYPTDMIACRRQDGRVDAFNAVSFDGLGPYILFSRDTMFQVNLAANTALLVKPVPRQS